MSILINLSTRSFMYDVMPEEDMNDDWSLRSQYFLSDSIVALEIAGVPNALINLLCVHQGHSATSI